MPMDEGVREEVLAIVAEIAEMDVGQIAPDALLRDLGIDSLGGLRIVAEVEKRYDIVIPEEAISRIRSMTDIFALVDRASTTPP